MSALTKHGHNEERVPLGVEDDNEGNPGRWERFPVFRDDDGTHWTFDPDGPPGLLCPCADETGRWSS